MTTSPPLVFVLGAGASKALSPNMPIGSELADRIGKALTFEFGGDQSKLSGPIAQALDQIQGGINDERLRAAHRIRYALAKKDSIDDLLDEWNDKPEMLEVGKIAIAHVILKSEAESYLAKKSTSDDAFLSTIGELANTWLGRVARHVSPELPRRSLADALQNVGFITFNYDRYVEQMLYGALRCQGAEKSAAYSAVERLPIVHAYGSVGSFNAAAVAQFGKESPVPVPLYQGIRTYTGIAHNGLELARIGSLLSHAKRIVFIGFGFHRSNMKLLFDCGLSTSSQIYGACPQPNRSRFEAARLLLYPGDRRARADKLTELECANFIEIFHDELFVS